MISVNQAEAYLQEILPKLGVNKTRELVRLIYEISKRDHLLPEQILPADEKLNFEAAKNILLKKRYPFNFKTAAKDRFYLPKLELNPALKADLMQKDFYPKNIYIEEGVKIPSWPNGFAVYFPKPVFMIRTEKNR